MAIQLCDDITVTVDLAGETVRCPGVAGRRRPDAALPARHRHRREPADLRTVTDRLYGGDTEHRLRQEIVLGVGGVRALQALGLARRRCSTPTRATPASSASSASASWCSEGLSFTEAVEAARAGYMFTTHTPVPAGIDRFPRELIERYFAGCADECGVTSTT